MLWLIAVVSVTCLDFDFLDQYFIFNYLHSLGPVHTYPDLSENASFLIRFGLASYFIFHI